MALVVATVVVASVAATACVGYTVSVTMAAEVAVAGAVTVAAAAWFRPGSTGRHNMLPMFRRMRGICLQKEKPQLLQNIIYFVIFFCPLLLCLELEIESCRLCVTNV